MQNIQFKNACTEGLPDEESMDLETRRKRQKFKKTLIKNCAFLWFTFLQFVKSNCKCLHQIYGCVNCFRQPGHTKFHPKFSAIVGMHVTYNFVIVSPKDRHTRDRRFRCLSTC